MIRYTFVSKCNHPCTRVFPAVTSPNVFSFLAQGATAIPKRGSLRFLGNRGGVNYYRRFPGDYLRDTAPLTLQQHGIYTLLLDYQYSTERRIAGVDEAWRIVHARTPRAKTDTEYVLARYFFLIGGEWTNKRFEQELKHCNEVSYKRKLAALSRYGKPAIAVQMDTYSRLHKKKESSNIELSQDHASPGVENTSPEKPTIRLTIENQKQELKRRGYL